MNCTNKYTFTELQIASIFQIPLTAHSSLVTNCSCFTKYLLTEMVSVHLEKKYQICIRVPTLLYFWFFAWQIYYTALFEIFLIEKQETKCPNLPQHCFLFCFCLHSSPC